MNLDYNYKSLPLFKCHFLLPCLTCLISTSKQYKLLVTRRLWHQRVRLSNETVVGHWWLNLLIVLFIKEQRKIPIDAHEAYKITKDLENIQLFLLHVHFLLTRLIVANMYLLNVIFFFITIYNLCIMNKNLLKIISVQK